jgi:hypothetical protein
MCRPNSTPNRAHPQRLLTPQTTLVELLQALQSDSSDVSFAVACCSRDTLDEVVAALAACRTFALAVLVSLGIGILTLL